MVTDEVTSYLYDSENRLIQATSASSTSTYSYDPLGRRIEKNVDGNITRYIYDGEDILLELNGLNIGKAIYTHGPEIDEPMVMERDTDADGFYDQRVYYHLDGLGSVKALTDDTGATVQSYQYDSFGKIISSTGTVESPYTYTSREFDSETGLYYYRARYYDAVNGRFMNEDPIGFEGGDVNLFRYVGGNPVNVVDPWGLDSLKFDGNNVTRYDDNSNEVTRYPATSGPFGNGRLPNGNYTGKNLRKRNDKKGMMCGNDGWSLDLNPNFTPNPERKDLRIHPDGNNRGTEGCIGVACSASERLYNDLKNYFDSGNKSIPVEVKY